VIDKDDTLLKAKDLQRLVECVIILFSPINFVRITIEVKSRCCCAVAASFSRRAGAQLCINPNARNLFFQTSKSLLSPLNLGSLTESMGILSRQLRKGPKNRRKIVSNHCPAGLQGDGKVRSTELQNERNKAPTEGGAVLPESTQPKQTETGFRWSVGARRTIG
jgi:hypothetical protein